MKKLLKKPQRKKKRPLGSIQRTYLPIREVRGSVVCLASSASPHERLYRSIVEVTGVNFWLLDEEEQASIYANFQEVFLSVSFPTQVIARVCPLDVNAYLGHLEHLEQDSPADQPLPVWQELAQSHAQWLRETTDQYTLLERKFYVVIPADDARVAARLWQRKRSQEQETLTFQQAKAQLHLRCDTISSHLVNMGLHVHELEGDALVELYDEMIGGTERCRQFPLTPEMLETERLDTVLAPASIRVERDHLVVDEQEYLRVLAIRGLPRLVVPGFLFRLIQSEEILDVVLHQCPLKQADATHLLKRKQGQYESAVIDAEIRGGPIDPTTRMVATDAGPLLEEVMLGNEQVHEFSVHVLVRAASREALEHRTKRVSEIMYTLFHFRPQIMLFEQEVGLKLCLPGNMIFRDVMSLDSSSVAAFYPFFSNLVYRPGDESILIGVTPDHEPIVMNLFELPNYNWFVLGPSGSGKSFAVKTVCERIYMTYKAREARTEEKSLSFQLFVIDPEREWHPLCERVQGQWVQLSPGSQYHINPFDLPVQQSTQRQNEGLKEDVLANQVQMLHHILDTMLSHHSPDNEREATLSVQEKALLDAALYETYRKVGITTDPDTHGRKPPLLRDLYHVLESEDVGKDQYGLANRLRRFVYGSLSGLFSEQTTIDVQNNLVCFDVRELDGELRPVGLMMVSNLVWNLSYASMIPRWLVIDELATLCRYRSGELFAREMFRRMRKMYGGVIGITQNVEMFRNSDIVSNAALHVLMKQDHSVVSQVAETFQLSSQEERSLRTFQKGQALILADGKRMVTNFVASALEYQLATTDPRELAQFERQRRELLQRQEVEDTAGEKRNGRAIV